MKLRQYEVSTRIHQFEVLKRIHGIGMGIAENKKSIEKIISMSFFRFPFKVRVIIIDGDYDTEIRILSWLDPEGKGIKDIAFIANPQFSRFLQMTMLIPKT